MGLTKSPTGVPWNHGIELLMREETRIYSDWLAEAWAQDPRRNAVLEESGLPADLTGVAYKTAAVGLWGHACNEIQASAGRSAWSVRQVASMNHRAFKAANRMPFAEWKEFMAEAVIPMLREAKEEVEGA